eukprot:s1250_g12.t1
MPESTATRFVNEDPMQQFLPWSHSIRFEKDYIDPFMAVHSAQQLRHEVLFSTFPVCSQFAKPLSHSDPLKTKSNLKSNLKSHRTHLTDKVHFSESVTLHMGTDLNFQMSCIVIPHSALLDWSAKPWQLWQKNAQGQWVRRAPLSDEAVLSSVPITPPIPILNLSLMTSVPISSHRLTDQHGQVEGFDAAREAATGTPAHFHPMQPAMEAPAFLRHLLEIAPVDAELTPDDDLIFYVRTWFIDHEHHPRCEHPRVVELNSEWQRWHQEIVSCWRDFITIDHPHDIHVVTPEPPRHARYRRAIADLILVVGVDVTRYVGLVTVAPIAPESEPLYAMALSFPAEVSGIMIRAASDSEQLCTERRCSIYHGWNEIPQNFERLHRMSNGDSLVIFHTPRNHVMTAVGSTDDANDALHQGADHDQDMGSWSLPHDSEAEMSGSQQGDSSVASSAPRADVQRGPPQETLQTVKLYMLHHPTVQTRVRWGNYANLLTDVARALRVTVAEITSLHYIRATPIGDTENEASIIVQFVNDVPDGSTDKLILLDVEVHQLTNPTLFPRSPGVSRSVRKVVLHMARVHLLILGRIQHFCQVHHDRCLVHLDHHFWSHQDLGVRTFAHGQYVRLTVPPAPSHDGDTRTAINIIEDDVEADQAYEASEGPLHRPGSNTEFAAQDAHADGPPAMQLKPNPNPDLWDVPVTLPPNEIPQRSRVFSDGNFAWMDPLSQFFPSQAFYDRHTGTSHLHILTWFVHHGRAPVCRRARPVRLEDHAIAWLDDLRHAWADVLDPAFPLTVHLVDPRPPQWRDHRYACHVLLEQANPGTKTAGILTGLIEGVTRDAIVQGAYSVEQPVMFAETVRLLEIGRFCQNQHVLFRRGLIDLSLTEGNDLPSGFSATVYVHRTPTSEVEQVIQHFDDLSLMQTTPAASSGNPSAACGSSGFIFNPDAPEFAPHQPVLAAQPEFIQDLHVQWQLHAMAWENEQPSAEVLTWMVDHRFPYPTCTASRRLLLFDDFTQWEDSLQQLWADLLVPALPLEFHLVTPAPPLMEPGIAAHVILIQAPRVNWVSSLVSVDDLITNAMNDDSLMRLVITTHEHILLEHVTQACGYGLQCVQPRVTSSVRCSAVIQREHLRYSTPWPGRSGLSIHLLVQRYSRNFSPGQRRGRASRSTLNLLQTHVHLRSTHVSPGMEEILQQSAQPLALSQPPVEVDPLECMKPFAAVTPDRMAIRVVSQSPDLHMPTFLDLPQQPSHEDIQTELRAWGYCDGWLWLPDLCVVLLHDEPMSAYHYFYVNEVDRPFHFTYYDVTASARHEVAHMRWLYHQGHPRAVLMQPPTALALQVFVVTFRNSTVPSQPEPVRLPTPWPQRMPVNLDEGPIWTSKVFMPPKHDVPSCVWNIGVQAPEIDAFFLSGLTTLCRSFEDLVLPAHVWAALQACEPLDRIDRIVIYADGSSLPDQRRRPPQQVETEGKGDTWAFIVLGEQYETEHASKINVLGWTAQPVLYDPDAAHHAGAQVVGSEVAEREAMFWCGAWRLALNSTTPTTICTDSRTSGRQADGQDGASHPDGSFQHLRAVYQCLEGTLGPHLHIQHVRGHSQDPWNDFVDAVAKQERSKSFYLPRQTLDMRHWCASLPHLWTVLVPNTGLPAFSSQGFVVNKPELPPKTVQQPTSHFRSRQVRFHVSLASTNVNSLYSSPDGYAGKLQFIREQMKAFQFNILGVQESRAPMTCTSTDQILRLGSGADKGHFGVELWINLAQPFATIGRTPVCLSKQHVVVVYCDPRILLARINHELWSAWILVAHAPQSGQPEDVRRAWWLSLDDVLNRFVTSGDLYVLLDANASPGRTDHLAVGPSDLEPSKSTPFLREFLLTRNLALPCTFDCHDGEQMTWTSPDGSVSCCIDMICLPQHVLPSCTLSQVVPDFDLGNGFPDHSLVAVQLAWTSTHWVTVRHKHSQAVDRSCIVGATLATPLSDFEVPSWSTDIHSHVTSHNEHLLGCLRQHCGSSLRHAKKSFITSDIWQLRADKLACRKLTKTIHQRARNELLRAVFMSWKSRDDVWCQEHALAYHAYCTALQCWRLHHGLRLHQLAKRLKHALRQARATALREQLTNLQPEAFATDILQVVKRCVGPTNLKTLKKPTLPMLRQPEGTMCATADQLIDEWVRFFGAMEGGQRRAWHDLEQHWSDHLAQFMQSEFSLGPQDVPTLTDLEVAFRRVKQGKALGLDGIPPEACHVCPTILARQYYSALLKLLFHGQESLHHKGGLLIPAYKGKGPVFLPQSYRSLLISSHMGKVLHRTVRQFQASLAETYMCAQQLGGRRKVPVTLGLQEARSFLRVGQQRGLSVGLLMVDLTEAFYRVLRPLAVGCAYTDEQIAAVASKLNMPQDTLHDLHRHLQEPDALAQANLPDHVRRTIQGLHTDTYFQVHGQQDCCHTTIGSRPGDSFADVVFSYLFARVLKHFQQHVTALGLQEYVPDAETFDPWICPDASSPCKPYLSPVWMDDLCIGATATTPAALLSKVGSLTSVLLETLESFGMTPNLTKGKTELLVSLRGAGVRACKKQLFGPHTDGTLPIVCEQEVKRVTVVGQYLHLGGQLHHGGDHRQEMRRRVAIAHSAFTAHRRSIFHNMALPLTKRVELFKTLVLSKLMYGSDSWVLRDIRSKEFLHTSLIRLYRRLLKAPHDAHFTDDDVLNALQLPSPTELMRQARLRHLGTLHNCQHVVTWGLLNSDSDWCGLIRDDLNWMWHQLSNSSSLRAPDEHFASWRYLWTYHGKYWKGLIKRAIQHAVLQRYNDGLVRAAHQNILSRLEDQGRLQVPQCVTNDAAHGPDAAALQLSQTHCSPVAGHGSQTNQHQEQQLNGLLPPIVSLGPRRPPPRVRDIEDFDVEWYGKCAEVLQSDTPFSDIPTLLQSSVSQMALSWTRFVSTVQTFRNHLTADDAEAFGHDFEAIRAMLNRLICVDTWPFLHQRHDDVRKPHETSLDEWEWKCDHSIQNARTQWCDSPRGFGVHRYVLHAFSGRRRPGDFQMFLDQITDNHPGTYVHTLSVDIILDSHWGNVADKSVQRFWMHAVQQRWVVGYLAGPPCETWSKAREAALSPHSEAPQNRGPRVIRTVPLPWGLHCLTLRELRQIIIGNQLMLFSICILVELSMVDGCGAIEHPAMPDNPESVSVWRTALMNLLRELPGFEILQFAQGLLGAVSAKPTMVLALNLPHLAKEICRWRVVDDLPKQVSIGRGPDGKFKTTSLKEYPPALCGALASASGHAIRSLPLDASVQASEEFFGRCQAMLIQEYGEAIGPDFAGGRIH